MESLASRDILVPTLGLPLVEQAAFHKHAHYDASCHREQHERREEHDDQSGPTHIADPYRVSCPMRTGYECMKHAMGATRAADRLSRGPSSGCMPGDAGPERCGRARYLAACSPDCTMHRDDAHG